MLQESCCHFRGGPSRNRLPGRQHLARSPARRTAEDVLRSSQWLPNLGFAAVLDGSLKSQHLCFPPNLFTQTIRTTSFQEGCLGRPRLRHRRPGRWSGRRRRQLRAVLLRPKSQTRKRTQTTILTRILHPSDRCSTPRNPMATPPALAPPNTANQPASRSARSSARHFGGRVSVAHARRLWGTPPACDVAVNLAKQRCYQAGHTEAAPPCLSLASERSAGRTEPVGTAPRTGAASAAGGRCRDAGLLCPQCGARSHLVGWSAPTRHTTPATGNQHRHRMTQLVRCRSAAAAAARQSACGRRTDSSKRSSVIIALVPSSTLKTHSTLHERILPLIL
jgi:hypothetical protein